MSREQPGQEIQARIRVKKWTLGGEKRSKIPHAEGRHTGVGRRSGRWRELTRLGRRGGSFFRQPISSNSRAPGPQLRRSVRGPPQARPICTQNRKEIRQSVLRTPYSNYFWINSMIFFIFLFIYCCSWSLQYKWQSPLESAGASLGAASKCPVD
ncbi:hypothetical protein VTN77DRAFT_6330 [Rasamsonia byssochlamydoides]|uniref:uncharacterized protein n=1 Tax=Rasamsonia byssochlamydoides TaxID=89139 RepID=UPI003743C536